MLKIKRFVNELMTSNCYVVYDEDAKRCLVIDPGSEKSLREIEFIENNGLSLDYIIMTHEHTDHNWGVNTLRERYKLSKLICSDSCNRYVKKTSRFYFLFYYDDPDYRYEIENADILISQKEHTISWCGQILYFLLTPGHSHGSMCIEFCGMLFSGDTIIPNKPYFNGRDSDENEWLDSINMILKLYKKNTIVYPGHAEPLTLQEWEDNYYKISNK